MSYKLEGQKASNKYLLSLLHSMEIENKAPKRPKSFSVEKPAPIMLDKSVMTVFNGPAKQGFLGFEETKQSFAMRLPNLPFPKRASRVEKSEVNGVTVGLPNKEMKILPDQTGIRPLIVPVIFPSELTSQESVLMLESELLRLSKKLK